MKDGGSVRQVLVADPRPEVRGTYERLLREAGFGVTLVDNALDALKEFYAQPPHCIVLCYSIASEKGNNLLQELKADNVYGHLPAILSVTAEELDQGIDWMSVPADDFFVEPDQVGSLVARVHLCWSRALRDVNANPLTGLPGNLIISREAERRIASGETFAFAYMDIDGFKAFNDRYGFSRGDEILRMTSRILVNTVRAVDRNNAYVGHVGGDDFVFITSSSNITKVCESIIASFDSIVPDFYDEDDRGRVGFETIDRQGNLQWYPLISSSIGAVDTATSEVKHIADLFSRVSEVKNFAKRLEGSNFIIDRRH